MAVVTLPDESTIEPEYDLTTGRISSLAWPEGVLTYGYDDMAPPYGTESHQLKSLALAGDMGNETLTFAYDGALPDRRHLVGRSRRRGAAQL